MATAHPRPELQENGARIAKALEARGLTHAEAAEALGVHPMSVKNWAEGRSAPSLSIQPMLAELLQLGQADLVPPGWVDWRSGQRPRTGTLSAEERRARDREQKQRKRETNRRYQERKRRRAAALEQAPGPAMQALSLAESMGHVPVPGPPRGRTPEADTLLATTIRADGLMVIKLNLTLPVTQGIALVQMLYAADALKGTLPAPTAEEDAP